MTLTCQKLARSPGAAEDVGAREAHASYATVSAAAEEDSEVALVEDSWVGALAVSS